MPHKISFQTAEINDHVQKGQQAHRQKMFSKHQILKYLSSSYIANKVTVYEQASDEDLCIHISEDMFLPLAERLYQEICHTKYLFKQQK
jgi:hypothetical protein